MAAAFVTFIYYRDAKYKQKMAECKLLTISKAIEESAKCIGFSYLKKEQQEAMEHFVNGKDTFVSLPTGYGKSVIYAALPGAFNRIKGMFIQS